MKKQKKPALAVVKSALTVRIALAQVRWKKNANAPIAFVKKQPQRIPSATHYPINQPMV